MELVERWRFLDCPILSIRFLLFVHFSFHLIFPYFLCTLLLQFYFSFAFSFLEYVHTFRLLQLQHDDFFSFSQFLCSSLDLIFVFLLLFHLFIVGIWIMNDVRVKYFVGVQQIFELEEWRNVIVRKSDERMKKITRQFERTQNAWLIVSAKSIVECLNQTYALFFVWVCMKISTICNSLLMLFQTSWLKSREHV